MKTTEFYRVQQDGTFRNVAPGTPGADRGMPGTDLGEFGSDQGAFGMDDGSVSRAFAEQHLVGIERTRRVLLAA